MKSLPHGAIRYKSTPVFDERTVPKGLLRKHHTKSGTWGKIVVHEGSLKYRILEPLLEEVLLSSARPGVIEPEVNHEVEPVGAVSFLVEFYRLED